MDLPDSAPQTPSILRPILPFLACGLLLAGCTGEEGQTPGQRANATVTSPSETGSSNADAQNVGSAAATSSVETGPEVTSSGPSFSSPAEDSDLVEIRRAEGPGVPSLPDSSASDPTQCDDSWGEETNGSVTWYTFDQGTIDQGDIHCSYGIQLNPDRVEKITTGAGQYFAAINTSDYDASASCGACVEITRVETGASVVATVVDECPIDSNPKCVKGHIDLSKAAFLELGEEVEGYLGQRAGRDTIEWKFVPCAPAEPVSLRLKEPDNAYWNEVVVEQSQYPVALLEVKVGDQWRTATRGAYNYFRPPNGEMGTAPYQVKETDMNGTVIETELTLSAGRQSTGEQFDCQE
ncbi:MAG: hypothetical protein MK135_04935 [Polyangiaceae bacterium]|nr:hypothetical protein [Polyangiaceae bacterium]